MDQNGVQGTMTMTQSNILIAPMGLLQLAITWYKKRHAGEQMTRWDIKNNATKFKFSLLTMSQRDICSHAWRFLYQVIASCKRPFRVNPIGVAKKSPAIYVPLIFYSPSPPQHQNTNRVEPR